VTLRTGGVSGGPFRSWNLADHVGDAEEAVRQNRELLRHRLKLPTEPFWLRQVHGTDLIPIFGSGSRRRRGERSFTEAEPQIPPGRPRADGSFTEARRVVCAVLTADCLPVLMTDGEVVAALHAGWRGLLGAILTRALTRIPWRRKPIVFLGPAIGVDAFAVGEEVYRAFLRRAPEFGRGFSRRRGKWHASLYRLAEIELRAHGIKEIYGGSWCTFSEPHRFFSYRREGSCGRMASLIWRV